MRMDQPFILDWRSAALGVCVVQLAVIAAAVLRSRKGGQPADLWLAGFLLVLAGVLTPYAIGYSGAYVRWPSLTFLPVALPLALGPTLWGSVHVCAKGRPMTHPCMHLLPAALQALYVFAAFTLPLDLKLAWVAGGHGLFAAPAFEAATFVSFAAYAIAIVRTLKTSDARLTAHQARWLWKVLIAFGIVIAVNGLSDLWAIFVRPADYDAQTWMYLVFAMSGLFLAVEGWRKSGDARRPPRRSRVIPASPDIGANYAERIRTSGWWREPELTVPTLARRLGASESSLARAIHAAVGCGVAHYVNALRADAVASALREGSRENLLSLALAQGFTSKSSFNRVFQARFGQTPSSFRREVAESGFVDA